jgi:hypothetical protein
MADAIELVDKDYSVAKKDRISSTQIKTRRKSFEAISRVWNKFRLSRIEKLLDMKKNSFVNGKFNADENSRLTRSAEKTLTKKSLAIAKLEEKIKIRSNEVVPVNYVNNRAIKIRKKMMDNLVANCDMSYSVDLDSRDQIFEEAENNNVNSINNGVSSTEIASALDEAMDKVSVEENIEAVAPVVTDVAETAVEPVVTETAEPVISEDNSVEATEVTNDIAPVEAVAPVVTDVAETAVEPVVTETTEPVISEDNGVVEATEVTSDIAPVEEVSTPVVTENIDTDVAEDSNITEVNNSDAIYDFNLDDGKALFEITSPEDEKTEENIVSENPINYNSDVSEEKIVSNDDNEIKVLKNNSSVARIDKYRDEVEKFEYKPMTAEEIEAARKNIEYDKYEKIYAKERKKVPVITFKDIFKPASQEKRDEMYNSILKSEISNSPTYINSESNDRYVPLIAPEREEKVNVYENDTTNDYESDVSSVKNLKEQYLQLQRMLSSKEAKLKSINAQRNELVNKVADSDKDVENINEIFKKKRMMMAQYINDIQQKCKDIDSETFHVEEELDMNKRRLEENMKLVSTTNDAIDEINQLLGENTNEHHYGKSA